MEKQMIEEMAKTYCQNGFKCDENCQTNGCRVYEVCTELYNAGYRKIPEGAVVVSKQVWEEHIENFDKCREAIEERVRKETAEKFAKMVSKAFVGLSCIDIDEWNWCQNKIDEICEEITEGKV